MSCGWKSKLAISLTPFIFLENKSGKCFAKYSFMIGVQTCFQFSGCKDYIFPGRSRLSKSAGSGLKFKTPPPSGSVFPGSLLSWVTALSGIWHFLPCGRIRASLVAMTCTHHVLKVKCWRMRTNIFFSNPGSLFWSTETRTSSNQEWVYQQFCWIWWLKLALLMSRQTVQMMLKTMLSLRI